MFSADFYMPTRLIFGDDALERGAEFIAAAGKHDDLLQTSHIYREVFESQTKGVE